MNKYEELRDINLCSYDQILLQEIKDLIYFSEPTKLRQSLQYVLFGFLTTKDENPLEQRAMEDFRYLIEMLDRLNAMTERD